MSWNIMCERTLSCRFYAPGFTIIVWNNICWQKVTIDTSHKVSEYTRSYFSVAKIQHKTMFNDAIDYFDCKSMSIEILKDGHLQKISFRVKSLVGDIGFILLHLSCAWFSMINMEFSVHDRGSSVNDMGFSIQDVQRLEYPLQFTRMRALFTSGSKESNLELTTWRPFDI